MISSVNGRVTCMGYAAFLEQQDTMCEWLKPLEYALELNRLIQLEMEGSVG